MGTPAIIQFVDDGTICAQLLVLNDGDGVPDEIAKVYHELRRADRMTRDASCFAAAYTVWRFDYHRCRYSMSLPDAVQCTPRPVLEDCSVAHCWRVEMKGYREPAVTQFDDEPSMVRIAEAAQLTAHATSSGGTSSPSSASSSP